MQVMEDLFKQRALTHIAVAAEELQKATSTAKNYMDAWADCQLSLHRAARSHCFLIYMQAYRLGVESVPDPACQSVLKQLYTLYGSSSICKDSWQGVLPINYYEHARKKIYDMLAVLRPNGVALVDAFDIPDSILNSSIGKYDGNVYETLYECARDSELNTDAVRRQLAQTLAPYLDREFLKKGNSKELHARL